MKKTNLFLLMIVFAVYNCANAPTTPEAECTPGAESSTAPDRGLPAPPGPERLSPRRDNVIVKGVVINGVEWATRNIDRDGTFVNNPEDPGWTYRWNSIRAEFTMEHSTAGLLPASFFTNYPAGYYWERSKDPSPEGWRIPTREEVNSLLDTTRVTNQWTTQNGVTGKRFTDLSSGENIFIPAAGRWYADLDAGERNLRRIDIGTGGYYWTATAQGDFGAITFEFTSGGASFRTNHRIMTNMIRPVADR